MVPDNKTVLIAVNKEDTHDEDVLDVLRCRDSVERVLKDRGVPVKSLFIEQEDFRHTELLREKLLVFNLCGVFNLFEGFRGDSAKEIEFAELLESMGLLFTGNGSRALSLCLDKAKAKQILRECGIGVPPGIFITRAEDDALAKIPLPVFIKPCCEDASKGIERDSLVHTRGSLVKVVREKLAQFPRGLIVEAFIPGTEYNVGFIGMPPYRLLGISVIRYSRYPEFPPYLTYSAKWKTDAPEFTAIMPVVDEPIEQALRQNIAAAAADAAAALGCRGYFRVDVREHNGMLFVLDVNPNPDLNEDSGFMRQAYQQGFTFGGVIEQIMQVAEIF